MPSDDSRLLSAVEAALASSVSGKLQDIAAQIEALQQKAREVVEEAICAAELHKAKYARTAPCHPTAVFRIRVRGRTALHARCFADCMVTPHQCAG